MNTAKDLKLYELTDALVAVLESAATDEGSDWEGQLETLLPLLAQKAGGCGRAFRMYGDRAAMMRERAKVFTEEARKAEAHQERIKSYVARQMEKANLDRLTDESGDVIMSFRTNPPAVVVDAGEIIPSEYIVTTHAPDKNAIKNAIKAGKEVPGCHLEQSRSLTIK